MNKADIVPFHDFAAEQFLKAQALWLRVPQNSELSHFPRSNEIQNVDVISFLKIFCEEELPNY